MRHVIRKRLFCYIIALRIHIGYMGFALRIHFGYTDFALRMHMRGYLADTLWIREGGFADAHWMASWLGFGVVLIQVMLFDLRSSFVLASWPGFGLMLIQVMLCNLRSKS